MPQEMQSILNQAIGQYDTSLGVTGTQTPIEAMAPGIPVPVSAPQTQVAVDPNAPKPINYMAMVANRQQGRKPESQLESDLNTLQPFDFKAKYGEATDGIMHQLMQAEGVYNNYMSQNRTIPQAVWDGFAGIAGSTASSAVGLAGLGVGLVDPTTGARIAKSANDINTFTEGIQSDPLQAHRLAGEARGAYQTQADAEAYQSDLDSGTNHLVATLSNYGRQVIHSVRNAVSDPMLLEQGTVDNAGALLVNYALTAGLGAVADAVAPATRAASAFSDAEVAAARTVDAASNIVGNPAGQLLNKSIPMASQGILMGGMAYQQAVGGVMNQSFDALHENSQVYRDAYDQAKLSGLSDADAQDAARTHTAGIAGRQAALIAGPLAAATAHISHLSEHPFEVKDLTSSLKDTFVKQPLEGGLVNATQQLAQNIANKSVVDPNTELTDNLAHAAGEGALYGLTAAATMQAPGLAVEGAKFLGSTALEAGGSAIKGTVNMLSHVFGGSSKAVVDAENAKTTISPEQMKAAAADVIASAPQVSEEVHQQVTEMDIPDHIKKNITDYVDGFHEAVLFDPSKEITNPRVPSYITDPLEGVTDRIEAINNLAGATHAEQDPEKKNQLASVLYDVMEPLEQFRHAGENVLDLLPTDTPIREMIERYQKMAGAADQLASVRKAEEGLKAHFTDRDPNSIKSLASSEIDTPVGNSKIDDVITNARVSPETGNIKAIDSVLAHAEAGHIALTPDQRSSLLGSRTILEARQQFIDAKKVNGVLPSEATRVSDEILTGKYADKATQTPSATQFFNQIYKAVRSGDLVKAKQELSDMGLFVQHQKNKAEAVNAHTANPDQLPKGAPYMALAPRSVANEDANGVRHWYTSTNNVKGTDPFVKPTSAGSVQNAHNVFADHTALTHVYNGLTEAFPQLGESKIAPAQIHPALAGDTTAKVAQQFEAGTRKVSDFSAEHAAQQEAVQKQQAAFDQKAPAESIVSKNLPEAQKAVPQTKVEVPAVPEVAPEPTVAASVEAPTPEASPEAPSTPVEAPAPEVTPTTEPAVEAAVTAPTKEPWEFSRPGIKKFNLSGEIVRATPGEAYTDSARPEEIKNGTAKKGRWTELEIKTANGRTETVFGPPDIASSILGKRVSIGVDTDFADRMHAVDIKPESEPVAETKAPEMAAEQVSTPASEPSTEDAIGPDLPGESDFFGSSEAEKPMAKTVQELHPNLIQAAKNMFYKAFGIRKSNIGDDSTRTLRSKSPVEDVRKTLTSNDSLKETLAGVGSKQILTNEVAEAYQKLLAPPSRELHTDLFRADLSKNKITPDQNARWMNYSGLVLSMQKNLESFLSEHYSNKTVMVNGKKTIVPDTSSPTLREVLAKGEVDMNRWQRGKALNITEADGEGSFGYDNNLMQSAAMAGLHWFITVGHGRPLVTEDDMESITGMKFADIPKATRNALYGSYSIQDVKGGITNAIRQFWGTNSVKGFDKAYTDGIVEAVAGEVMRGMVDTGFLGLENHYIAGERDEVTGKSDGKEHVRFSPNNPVEPFEDGQLHPLAGQFEHLYAYKDALADAVMIKPVHTTHLGTEEDLPAPDRQMNSDTLNTPQQKSAVDNANKITHQLDLPMLNLYYQIGHNGLKNYFGGGALVDEKFTNKSDLDTRKGKNITVGSASRYLVELTNQMVNRSLATGEHLSDIDIRFEHNMSKVGRMQMLGANNPQSSKLTREVILPTWSNLDLLSNSSHLRAWNLALAQAVGIKVETMSPEASSSLLELKMAGSLSPILRLLDSHIQDQGSTLHEAPKETDMEEVSTFGDKLHQAFLGAGIQEPTPVMLHALLEKVRFENAEPEEQKAFRTSLYLEADGKTNGPMNSMGMLANGNFEPEWVSNIRKGGFSIGPDGQSLYKLDPVDLYTTAAGHAQLEAQSLYKKFGEGKSARFVKPISDSLVSLMADFLPGIKKSGDSFELDRKVAKNPLTITIYGSGERGIAGNLSGELLNNISDRMTKALRSIQDASRKNEILSESEAMFPNDDQHAEKFAALADHLNNVFGDQIIMNKTTGEYFTGNRGLEHEPLTSENLSLRDFKATSDNVAALTQNMHEVLVKPLVRAIGRTVGEDVMNASRVLQSSTNKQSMVYVEYIKNAVRKAMAERAGMTDGVANDPTYKKGDFLSQDAFDQIIKEAAPLAPLAHNGDQNVMMAKSSKYTDDRLQYSRTLDDRWGTSPEVAIPGYAGVAGGPFSVISNGDGHMIQSFFNGPSKGERTLPVFDGLHMPLDKIDDYGQLINHNAMDAWMNNPMTGVRDSYIEMLKHPDMIHQVLADQLFEARSLASDPENGVSLSDAMSQKMVLAKNLLADIDPKKTIHEFDPNNLHDFLLDGLRKQALELNQHTASIDARHEVLSEVGLSSDQMASADAPYHNGISTTVDTSDPEATAADLNASYNGKIKGFVDAQPKIPEVGGHGDFLDNRYEPDADAEAVDLGDFGTEAVPDLNQVTDMDYSVDQAQPERPTAPFYAVNEAPTSTPEREAFHALTQSVGRGDSSGVRVLSQTAVRNLVRKMASTDTQKRVLSEIFRAGGTKDYKVISGTPDEIARYSDKIGSGTYADMVGKDGKLNGFVSIGEKAIYLVNPSAETLTHELIHASTFESVLAHYNGEKLHPETHAAVGRLEGLMDAFTNDDFVDGKTSSELVDAVRYAKASIDGALFNPDGETAVNKAKALNEFMAWTLSNKALAERLTDKSPIQKFVTLAKNVIAEIKNIFWTSQGRRAPKVGDDMLSNIQFNTGILMRDRPLASRMLSDATLQHFEADGDERLANLRTDFVKNVVQSIDSLPEKTDEQIADKVAARESFQMQRTNGEVADHVRNFFPMTMNEATTFNVISAALASHTHLDPTFVNRAQELYSHVIKHVSVTDFIDPTDHDQLRAEHNAQAQYNVLLGRDENAVKYDKVGLSNIMPSFISLAMVNKGFRDVLEKIPAITAEKSTRESRVDRFVENVFSTSMNKISSWLSGDLKATNVRESVDALAAKIHEHAADEASWLKINAGKLDGAKDYINNQMVNALTHLSDKGIALADTMKNSNSDVAQQAAGLVRMLSGHLSEKNGDLAAESLLSSVNVMGDLPVLNAMKKFTQDLVGRTKANAGVYDMIKQVRSMVAQVRQNYRDNVPRILDSKFSAAPSAEMKTHMFHGFGRSDLASLMGSYSTKDTLRLLTDPTARAKLVANLELQLRNVDPANFDIYKQKMNQLADRMMGGGPGVNLLRNATAISKLLSERVTDKPVLDESSIRNIDQLTTLYAIDRMPAARHEALSSLVQSEPAGTQFMMDYLHGQRKAELGKVTGDSQNENNHYKGYIPSQNEMGSELRVAPDSMAGELKLLGLTRVGKYEGSTLEGIREPKSYYAAPINGRSAFAQGIIQNADHTASGIDSVTGFSTHQVAGRILDRTHVSRITARMGAMSELIRNNPDMAVDTNTEHLMPVYNANDEVYAYERAMDPSKLAMRNPSTDISQMAGQWRGRQIEEGMSNMVNHTLVDRAYAMYQDETNAARPGGSKEREYVNLLDPRQTNVVQKDGVRLFNQDTQDYIASKFGEGQFMVRKDLVDDVIGYRHASIGDMWTGNSNWRPEVQHAVRDTMVSLLGPDAYRSLVSKEQFIQGAMGDIRRNIAVKMLSIPVMRAVDNVYQLSARGIPIASIVRGTAIKMHEISAYNKSREREIEIEAELQASANDPARKNKLTAELQSIKDSQQRLSTAPLINAGEFSTINGVGDVTDNVELSSGKIMDWLEGKARQLPPQIRTAARYGILSRDTALFEGMEKLAEYSDFVAKGIYYDHLTKQKGMNSKDAIGRVSEEYVNFDRSPGRSRAYTDNMGLTWFLNYKIRIAKVALSMMRNNPLHALLSTSAPAFQQTGNVFEDNIFSKIMDGSIRHSIGPAMAAHGMTIGPWYNLAK